MTPEEVLWCSIENWYPSFKKVTFKTIILPIPNEVLDYLKSDGSLVLPKECEKDTENDESDDTFADEENETEPPSFPEFNLKIEQAIEQLGGHVFPKLNWSAPRDAKWMGIGHSLKCENLTQIWLLLKSSEFIVHDLIQPFKDCETGTETPDVPYVLTLKKWSSKINPATEFRCFVKNGQLIGIEQRDPTNFYKHILDEKEDITRDIKSFFHEHVQEKLRNGQNVVMDITRPTKDVVKLVDFNPFGETTDVSFFDWTELKEKEFSDVEFRFVQSSSGILPTGLTQYSVPKDIVDLASGSDPEKHDDFLQLLENIQRKEALEPEDDD